MAADKVSPKKLSDLVTGGTSTTPPALDLDSGFEAAMEEANRVQAAGPRGGGAAAPANAGWLGQGDWYEGLINRAAEALPESILPKTGNSPGAWARWAGGMAIPQNSPELAVAALTAPLGGPLFSTGTKLGAKVAAKAIPHLLRRVGKQAVKTGAVSSVAGGATGHDYIESGLLGAIGGGLGQTVSDIGGAAFQTKAVHRVVKAAGDKVRDFVGRVFPHVPGPATAKDAWTRIITGENVERLEQEILNLGQRYTRNPAGFDPRLDPEIMTWANVALGRAGADAHTVLKQTTQGGMRILEPQLAAIWKYSTPAGREFLIKKGYILTQGGEAQAYKDLAKEVNNAKLIQQWVTGVSDMSVLTPEAKTKLIEDVKTRLFTPDMELTPEGLGTLGRQFAPVRRIMERRMGPAAVTEVEGALSRDVSHGLQHGVSGETPAVDFRWKPPFVEVKRPGVLPYVPGWEKDAGATLGEGAIKALTPPAAAIAAQGPLKPNERPVPPPPVIERPPPQDAPVLGEPPPADRREADPDRWFVPPPPSRPTPPDWFKGETPAAKPNEEMEVNLSTGTTP